MRSLPPTKIERDRGKPADPLRNSIQRAQKNSLATKFFPFYSSPYPMTHHRHRHVIPTRDRFS
ncbi:hypothetical protein CFB52_017750 [Burkholderia sp. AU18528]|nr:hypothetical protein CFB52_017750 [Burkholderia sp. AU18528]